MTSKPKPAVSPARTPRRTEPRTRELYDRLLEAFRERPGNVRYAARQTGAGRTCARTAWDLGWKGIVWARPIRARLHDEGDQEKVAALTMRAQRQAEADARRAAQDAEQERARAERVTTLAEELQVSKAMRGTVRQAAGIALALTPAMQGMVAVVKKAVFDVSTGLDGKEVLTLKATPSVDAKVAMEIIARWGTLVGKVAMSGDVTIHLGMEQRGPDEHTGVTEDMGPEEAREEIEHLIGIWKGVQQVEGEASGPGGSPGQAGPGEPTPMPPTAPPGTTTH